MPRRRADPARAAPRRRRPRASSPSSAPVALRRGATSRDIVDRAEGNAFFVEELVGAASGPRRLASPTTSPTCCWSGSTGLDDAARQVVRAASRRRPPGLPRAARAPPSSCRPPRLDRGRARRRRGATSWSPAGDDYYRSGTPCSPRRCTTTCCPASGSGCTRRTPRPCATGVPAAPPPSWPATPGWPRTYATALTASLRAGDEARAVGGPDEAAHHYQQALELLADSRAPEGSRPRLPPPRRDSCPTP